MGPAGKSIVVYGGTGYYGRKVVQKLVLKGQPVKVVSRDRNKARKILGEKVEIWEGDVTERDTIVKSLENVRAVVVCLSAMSSQLIRKMKAIERDAVLDILAEAEKQNISRLLYMSGYEMRPQLLHELNMPEFGAVKIEIEAAIQRSSFNWTILGDAPAFEIFFAFLRNNKMIVPGGGRRAIPCISAEDVGEITAQAALRDDLQGKRLKLTGPEAFTFSQATERIASVLGKNIKHAAIPLPIVNMVSALLWPLNPFPRFLYKSLKLLNYFPPDLAQDVPQEHKKLRSLFDYEPVTLEMEAKQRMNGFRDLKPLLSKIKEN